MTVRGVVTLQGTDISALINEQAARNGLPAQALLAQLIAEAWDHARGGLDEQAERDGVWPDWSVGLGQQTGKYAIVGDGTASEANKALVRAYYFQPANAIQECAAQLGVFYGRFADLTDPARYYEASSRYNGGSGLAFADNPNQANIRGAWDRAAEYEVSDVPTLTYNADFPRIAQTDDWSCSVASVCWALNSIGIPTDYYQLETLELRRGLVSTSDGLLDGSGAQLARFLGEQSGLGADVERQYPAAWEWVQSIAGKGPVLLGGGHWGGAGHWVAVRGLDADGNLRLSNPADGYAGIYETLTAANFAVVSPVAAIWLPVDTEDEVTQAEYDALKAELTDLQNYTGGLGHDILAPTVAELHAAAADPKAKRADLQATLERIALRLQPYVVE